MTQHSHEHTHDRSIDPRGHHDWHSAEYVKTWIDTDVTRDDERRPLVRQMLAHAPQQRDAALDILDVGAGYGLLSDEALKWFPNARVTLQDYSDAMFAHARERLAEYVNRTRFVIADFGKPDWANGIDRAFDVAISGIAIHNLGEPALIWNAYNGVASLLKPGGVFLDLDYLNRGLTAEDHIGWLKDVGFTSVQTPLLEERRAMFVARR